MPVPLALIGAGVSAYGAVRSAQNKPRTLNQDFSFNLATPEYSANPNMLASINNLNSTAGNLGEMGNTFNQQYQDMIDPNSAYNQSQIAQAGTQVADANTTQMNNIREAVMGTGGPKNLSNLLGHVRRNQGAESLLNATNQIRQNSVNQAGQFGQLGMNAYGQQGNMYAQAGGLGSQIDARQLNNDQFNAQNQNQYNQYLKTSQFNQDSANAQNSWAHKNATNQAIMGAGSSLLGMTGSIPTQGLSNMASSAWGGMQNMFGGGMPQGMPVGGNNDLNWR